MRRRDLRRVSRTEEEFGRCRQRGSRGTVEGLGRRRRECPSWQRLRMYFSKEKEIMRTLALALTLLTAAACTTYTPTTTDTGPYGSTTAGTAYVPGTLV